MLNLDAYVDRTSEIKFAGKVLNVHEVTVSQYERMIKIENMEGLDAHEKQVDFIAEVLSHNLEKRRIERKEIENLPKAAVNALWNFFILQSLNTISEKN